MTSYQYCPSISTSSLLGLLGHTVPTNLPHLTDDKFLVVDDFLSSFVPTTAITDLASVLAAEWSSSNPVFDSVPTKALNSKEVCDAIPELGAIYPSVIHIVPDSRSSQNLRNSVNDAKLPPQIGSKNLTPRTLNWPLPFGATTAIPLPASTGFGAVHGVKTNITTAPSLATSLPVNPNAGQNQNTSTVIDYLRNDTVTVTATNTLVVGPPSSTEFSVSVATHFVQVGAFGDLIFDPVTVNAAVGDIVEFEFLATNHSLTQSTLEEPCRPSNAFDSGFQYFNPTNQSGVINQRLVYLVTDSEPHWFFCRQQLPVSHCHAGMVFSINAGEIAPEFSARATQMISGDKVSAQAAYSTVSISSTGVSTVNHSAFTLGVNFSSTGGGATFTTGAAVGNHQTVGPKMLSLMVFILAVCWPYFSLSFHFGMTA